MSFQASWVHLLPFLIKIPCLAVQGNTTGFSKHSVCLAEQCLCILQSARKTLNSKADYIPLQLSVFV